MLNKLRISFFRYWRFLNTVAVVMGIVLPWRWAGSDVAPFEAWPVYGWWEIKDSLTALAHIENYAPQFVNYRAVDIAILIGAFSLSLYISGNLCEIFLRATDTSKGWSLFLRVTSLASALLLLRDFISPMMNSRLAIGYYIIAIAIFGSFLIEGNNRKNPKLNL